MILKVLGCDSVCCAPMADVPRSLPLRSPSSAPAAPQPPEIESMDEVTPNLRTALMAEGVSALPPLLAPLCACCVRC